jgi:hypothetical protein
MADQTLHPQNTKDLATRSPRNIWESTRPLQKGKQFSVGPVVITKEHHHFLKQWAWFQACISHINQKLSFFFINLLYHKATIEIVEGTRNHNLELNNSGFAFIVTWINTKRVCKKHGNENEMKQIGQHLFLQKLWDRQYKNISPISGTDSTKTYHWSLGQTVQKHITDLWDRQYKNISLISGTDSTKTYHRSLGQTVQKHITDL